MRCVSFKWRLGDWREHGGLFPRLGLLLALTTAILSSAVTTAVPVRAGSYDRGAAVAYSDYWAHGRNPNYVDFSDNDCTNFNSQALNAGGLPQIQGDGYLTNAANWYYYGAAISYSWRAADYMNQHFSDYQGSRFNLASDISGLTSGDVVIYLFPGESVPTHGGSIVGYGNSSGDSVTYPVGTYGLLRNQHSTDKYHVIWDDNVASGTGYWPWQIIY